MSEIGMTFDAKYETTENLQLFLDQAKRQLEHAEVNLKHSGNRIGARINQFTLNVWRLIRIGLEDELEKRIASSVRDFEAVDTKKK